MSRSAPDGSPSAARAARDRRRRPRHRAAEPWRADPARARAARDRARPGGTRRRLESRRRRDPDRAPVRAPPAAPAPRAGRRAAAAGRRAQRGRHGRHWRPPARDAQGNDGLDLVRRGARPRRRDLERRLLVWPDHPASTGSSIRASTRTLASTVRITSQRARRPLQGDRRRRRRPPTGTRRVLDERDTADDPVAADEPVTGHGPDASSTAGPPPAFAPPTGGARSRRARPAPRWSSAATESGWAALVRARHSDAFDADLGAPARGVRLARAGPRTTRSAGSGSRSSRGRRSGWPRRR